MKEAMKKENKDTGKNSDFSYWNYRVIRKKEKGAVTYAIHEVYYNARNKPVACTVEPVYPQGETFKEIKEDMKYYLLALKKQVLKYETIGNHDKKQ